MKRKHWLIALIVLVALLMLASIPRIDEINTADSDEIQDYPVLYEDYTDLCEEYSLYKIVAEDTIHIVTIKNLWGSWQRYILSCYAGRFPDIPTAGSVRCGSNLLVLAPWSEENIFTNMFRLKVRDFSLYLEPGENLFISSPFAELTHANLSPVTYLVQPDLIDFSDAVICNQLPTVSVEYSMSTLDSTKERKQPVITTLTWDYSLRFMGKKIRTGPYVLEMEHIVNA